jgi:hypothetical protein
MVKRGTRKHRSRRAHSGDYHMCEHCRVTFCGIGHWYKHLFEELGWMILAKDRGMTDKTMVYLNSIKRCKMEIEHRLTHIHDADDEKRRLENYAQQFMCFDGTRRERPLVAFCKTIMFCKTCMFSIVYNIPFVFCFSVFVAFFSLKFFTTTAFYWVHLTQS